MSSFKRKVTSKTLALPGTRPSPGSISTTITSTGIASLDDILGGGLPLSCSLVVAAPDPHSSYGELVQKIFVSQGLACKQDVLVVGNNQDALDWVKNCMWFHSSASPEEAREDQKPPDEDQKIKIAWRYEQMKQFQTTVASASYVMSEDFCRTFDLTTRIPASTVDKALRDGQLVTCDILSTESLLPTKNVITRIKEVLSQRSSKVPSTPLRICIPSLGSPAWGDLRSEDILRFLHRLRSLLRQNPLACASVSLEPHLSTDTWAGSGWIQKVGWMCDGLIILDAFTSKYFPNPSLLTLFPSHHGMARIHTFPSPHTLLPPSDRFSTLRGLAASGAEGGTSGGENNLAFKCTRKRLIFETMHLDVEGGVGERRTTPASIIGIQVEKDNANVPNSPVSKAALASVEVKFELESATQVPSSSPVISSHDDLGVNVVVEEAQAPKSRIKKPKKSVAFQSDRPDLYDF
ncbi:hypothetical protein GYMLUDRAFT_149590 [Collybiopsis luxurians FD-317 M1]|nr:hypothetical protein GYMLUDRAFT_149590 [Collybiopsis luxurians FD-317 M1]